MGFREAAQSNFPACGPTPPSLPIPFLEHNFTSLPPSRLLSWGSLQWLCDIPVPWKPTQQICCSFICQPQTDLRFPSLYQSWYLRSLPPPPHFLPNHMQNGFPFPLLHTTPSEMLFPLLCSYMDLCGPSSPYSLVVAFQLAQVLHNSLWEKTSALFHP